MIQLEKVSKIYWTSQGPLHALCEVDLHVGRGEFVAVCGPSGCGKSTLLTLIGGLGTPSAGRVLVDGQDVGAMPPHQRAAFRARRIGFVFQMFHLLPYLNVLENVLVAVPFGQRAAARDRADALLRRFQLSDRIHHRPGQLSTGECQRVAIARALVNQPEVILADEPTGNLDEQNADTVLDILKDFHNDGGTVVLVTHHSTAAARASRIVYLDHGAVVAPSHA